MLFKLPNLNSNLALTLGYLNPALNNSTLCYFRGTQRQFSENICSEDDLRSRIFGTFVVKSTCSIGQFTQPLIFWLSFSVGSALKTEK